MEVSNKNIFQQFFMVWFSFYSFLKNLFNLNLIICRCDNIKDCATGEDEEECKFCEHEQFRCLSNDKCIPDKWRCDQYEDCPDASDEMDCFSDEESGDYPITFGNGRTYPFAQEQAFNQPNKYF